MKFVDDFESFLRTVVNLNQGRLDLLQKRVNAIDSFLADDETFEPIFLELIPAGSWAHRTIIKPVADNDGFDADVLLHVEEQEDWQPKNYLEELTRPSAGAAPIRRLPTARRAACGSTTPASFIST